jgi:hypothetical protein
VAKDTATVAVSTSLSWMPCRMALLPRESSLLRCFLRSSRLRPHILPVHLHDVIGDEDRLCLSLARSQRLEIGSGIGPQNSRLAIEHCAIDRQGRYVECG